MVQKQVNLEISDQSYLGNVMASFKRGEFFQIIMGYSVGLEDLKHPITLTKCVVAEFLGTMFLVIIGCGTASVSSNDYSTKAINHLVIQMKIH